MVVILDKHFAVFGSWIEASAYISIDTLPHSLDTIVLIVINHDNKILRPKISLRTPIFIVLIYFDITLLNYVHSSPCYCQLGRHLIISHNFERILQMLKLTFQCSLTLRRHSRQTSLQNIRCSACVLGRSGCILL